MPRAEGPCFCPKHVTNIRCPSCTCTLPSQYLCCELAALQLSGQLFQLQVFDVAHIAWRLQVACELETIDAYQQVGGPRQQHLLHTNMS